MIDRTFCQKCCKLLSHYIFTQDIEKLLIRIVVLFLYLYRYTLSPLLGPRCRFYPSCSRYAIAAVQNHGIIRGLFLAIKRLLKCHPWNPGGFDPIPPVKK